MERARNVAIAIWWEARYQQAHRRDEVIEWVSRDTWWYDIVLGSD